MTDREHRYPIRDIQRLPDGRYIAQVDSCAAPDCCGGPETTPTVAEPGWQRGPYDPNHTEGTQE